MSPTFSKHSFHAVDIKQFGNTALFLWHSGKLGNLFAKRGFWTFKKNETGCKNNMIKTKTLKQFSEKSQL